MHVLLQSRVASVKKKTNPQSYITCNKLSYFSIGCCEEKTSTITPKEHGGWRLWLVRQVSQLCLHVDLFLDVISDHYVQEEGCGSFEAHQGGSTSSNLLFTLWPTCMNLAYDSRGNYMSHHCRITVSVDSWSTTAAAAKRRGAGTGTGTVNRWMSQQTQPKTSASDWNTQFNENNNAVVLMLLGQEKQLHTLCLV